MVKAEEESQGSAIEGGGLKGERCEKRSLPVKEAEVSEKEGS